jgi:CBS domain-containing protein
LLTRDIMSHPVVTAQPGEPLLDVIKRMAEHSISGVVVVEDDRPVGMISESDLLYRVAHPHLPPVFSLLGSVFMPGAQQFDEALRKMTAVTARDLMTPRVFSVIEDTPIPDLADLMVEKKIRRVPVVRADKLVGIVTRGDLVRRFLAVHEEA